VPDIAFSGIGAVWSDAHQESVKLAVPEKASYLLETIGPRLAAAALGLSDARQIKRWSTSEDDIEPREQLVAQRLDALYWIVRAVATVYSTAVAARFIRSSNPQLDDSAPLVALAESNEPSEITRVVAATRAFIEG
jgi:hypothetical protein